MSVKQALIIIRLNDLIDEFEHLRRANIIAINNMPQVLCRPPRHRQWISRQCAGIDLHDGRACGSPLWQVCTKNICLLQRRFNKTKSITKLTFSSLDG